MAKRLLLVDDEPRNLVLLERHLAPLEHELLRAHDGPSAIKEFEQGQPDLVLLDIVMPGMGGLEVLKALRARGGGDRVPVILVTAYSEREQRRRGLEAGADEFLERPVDGPILRARVTRLLQQKESGDALRRLNDELSLRNAALERLQREQRELVGFIVHDLKNPLSTIWSSLDFVQNRATQRCPELSDALSEASAASRRLQTMIEDLLTISRLEESSLPLRPEPVALLDFLGEVLRGYRRRAAEKPVQLIEPEGLEARVRTDRTLLQRVIENILDNALRYTPERGRIAVAMLATDHVEIAVSNTGPSIPPSERTRIFEKFTRLEDQRGAGGNAGLGLYFCKRALESLDGHIEVRESDEWPVSFVVHLPASDEMP